MSLCIEFSYFQDWRRDLGQIFTETWKRSSACNITFLAKVSPPLNEAFVVCPMIRPTTHYLTVVGISGKCGERDYGKHTRHHILKESEGQFMFR